MSQSIRVTFSESVDVEGKKKGNCDFELPSGMSAEEAQLLLQRAINYLAFSLTRNTIMLELQKAATGVVLARPTQIPR